VDVDQLCVQDIILLMLYTTAANKLFLLYTKRRKINAESPKDIRLN
jgi:hypothetical protein